MPGHAQAFDKWRAEHVATALQVRARLEEGAADSALRPVIEEARGQLWTLFAMKKAVVCSESVLLIMNLEHLLPPVRMRARPLTPVVLSALLSEAASSTGVKRV